MLEEKYLAVVRLFNRLPGPVRVLVYSCISTILSTLLLDLQTDAVFEWKKYLIIPITAGINILAYLVLREKGDEQFADVGKK